MMLYRLCKVDIGYVRLLIVCIGFGGHNHHNPAPDSFPAAGRRLLGLARRNIPLW